MFKNGTLASMIVTSTSAEIENCRCMYVCVYTNFLIMICVFPVCKRNTTKVTADFTVVFEPNLLLIVRQNMILGCGGFFQQLIVTQPLKTFPVFPSMDLSS